jgi:uncharacterized surface protein with fasciclin (FAS1) repeats
MTKGKWLRTAVVAAAVLSPAWASAQSHARGEGKPMKDIVATAAEAGPFTTLLKAAEVAGLADVLKSAGPYTVFAPTDAAFAALPAGALQGLLAKPEELRSVLLYHVVAGEVPASVAMGLSEAPTMNGAKLTLHVADGQLHVDGATVTQADIRASNGVIHVIDAVVLPRKEVPAGP